MKLDDGLERIFRRLIGRPRRQPTQNIGLITRSLFVMIIDGVILNVIFLLVAASPGLRRLRPRGDPNGVSTAGIVFGLGAWIAFGSALSADLLVRSPARRRGCA